MKRKTILTLLTSALLIALTACGIINPSSSTSGAASSNANQQAANSPAAFDPSKLTADQKLVIGTLKLEGTPQVVTAQQAVDLLPLWKAVRTLSASSTASQDEVTALYQQIRDTMTADQRSAIDKMTITTDDFTTLMGNFGAQNDPAANSGTQATRQANRQSSNFQAGGGPGGGPAGGPPAGGNMPPGGFDGGGPMAQGTPQETRTASRSGMGMMNMFIQPLINLLETRAGVATSTPPAPPAPPAAMLTPTPTAAP